MTAGKECNICGDWRPIEQYSAYKQRGKVHLRGDCKECVKARQKARYYALRDTPDYKAKRKADAAKVYRNNRDKIRAAGDKWYAANRERVRLNRIKRRMRKAGLKV